MAVLLQVLRADIMVDANNTPLQQAERPSMVLIWTLP